MRKLMGGVLLAVMLVTAAGGVQAPALAATHGMHYIDANKDGICDYCGGKKSCNLEICDAHGKYCADTNQDGICDNYVNGCHTRKQKSHCGQKYRSNTSKHHQSGHHHS